MRPLTPPLVLLTISVSEDGDTHSIKQASREAVMREAILTHDSFGKLSEVSVPFGEDFFSFDPELS